MSSNGTLIEIPRSDGSPGIRINPLLVSAITRYEAAGQDQPNKCMVNVLGTNYKFGYPADVVADMLGLTIVIAEIPVPDKAEKGPATSPEPKLPSTPTGKKPPASAGGNSSGNSEIKDKDL